MVTDPGGEQDPGHVLDRKAPIVAGLRADAHAQRARRPKQPAQPDSRPPLGGVEAASAIQGSDDAVVEGRQLVIGPFAQVAVRYDLQPPACDVYPGDGVEQPLGYRHRRRLKRGYFV